MDFYGEEFVVELGGVFDIGRVVGNVENYVDKDDDGGFVDFVVCCEGEVVVDGNLDEVDGGDE